jgi:hypothetical protein
MSSDLAEAHANLARVLDGVLARGGERRYVICDLSEDGANIVDLYKAATRYLETKLGRPNYSGRGGAYPSGNEGANPGVFVDDYSRSTAICWWKTDQGVFAALVSAHDADTLFCLTVVFVD